MSIAQTPIPTKTPLDKAIIGFIFDYILPIALLVIMIVVFIVIIRYVLKRRKSGKGKDLLFKDFNVGKYSIIMFRKINDRYIEIERLKMSITNKVFNYKGKEFITFDINMPFFSDKDYNYYGFDYDSGEILTVKTKGMPKEITIDDIDTYVNRGIIEQIVRSLETPQENKGKYLLIVVGLILGIGIGLIIGQSI